MPIHMQESILVYLVKKYLWEFVLGAICLTMVQNALDNIGGEKTWVKIAKGVVNGLYASFFFAGFGGFYFNEVGIIAGILLGTAVGFAGVKDFANSLLQIYINKKSQ